MLTINSYEEFEKYLGQELGKSDWLEIDQDRINAFADATLDHQWIHVDPERAKNGPFGQTIVLAISHSLFFPICGNRLSR